MLLQPVQPLLGIALQATAISAVAAGPKISTYKGNATRANAVKEAFEKSWDGYYKYAFPHDTLRPVSNSFEDDRNGWGASAIDALSTAVIMEESEIVNQILDFIPTIDFDKTDSEVSVFETTIRYLGGFLSGYDLLNGPLKGLVRDESKVEAILGKAAELADNLAVAFDTPTGIPDNTLVYDPTPRQKGDETNGIATIGTLILEWTRLSDLTGNTTYAELTRKAEQYLLDPQPKELAEPFPGLIGTDVNITTGLFIDGDGGWGGGDDSFYEYLIKFYMYDSERFEEFVPNWVDAIDSSIKYLASHPTSRPELTFLNMYSNTTLQPVSQHLACFDGGNFILGGLTLDKPDYVDFGIELVKACHETYIQTATRIGPEVFRWQDAALPANATNNPGPPADKADFYERAGFWVDGADYVLRPEVIEGYYYAYRATGDVKYQEWAWDAFEAIVKACEVGSGFSSINDVNAADGGGYTDFQESFWFAEVLKYSYLIQDENQDADYHVKADHTNKFVYNTECHPIKIAGPDI